MKKFYLPLIAGAMALSFAACGGQKSANGRESVELTGAGATFPYGKDPEDKNIRIAPSFATPDELKEASEILIICTKITALEKILGL